MSGSQLPYLFVKHSENWNVDRCTQWMANNDIPVEWCYPVSDAPFPEPQSYAGVVVFGGAPSANDCSDHEWVRRELVFVEKCLKHDVPLFGICLGAQMLARVLGANVRPHERELKEVGFFKVNPVPGEESFLSEPLTVMQWHSEGFDLPTGTQRIASGDDFPNQGYRYGENALGVQFHPEVNPEALAIWHERNQTRTEGVLSDRERTEMMADAYRHDSAITQWLDGFMTQWTKLASRSC